MRFTPSDDDGSGEGWRFGADDGGDRRWFFVVLAVLLLVLAVWPLTVGQYVIPALLAGGAAVMLVPLFIGPREPMAPVLHDGPEGGGLLLPTYPMRLLAIIGFALFGGVLVVAGFWVGVSGLRDDRPGMLFGTVIGVVLGGICLSGAWFGLWARMKTDQGVLLSESGISVLGHGQPLVMGWPALTGMRAHWTRGSLDNQARLALTSKGPDTFRNWLSFQVTDFAGENPQAPFARTAAPTVDADDLAVDPYTVLAVCQYYLEHPEARGELTTSAALERVRTLAPEQSEGS